MPAFESAGIFDRLVHQAAILYQPATPASRSGLFVAAREELRRSIIKEDQASGSVLFTSTTTSGLACCDSSPAARYLLSGLPAGTLTPIFQLGQLAPAAPTAGKTQRSHDDPK